MSCHRGPDSTIQYARLRIFHTVRANKPKRFGGLTYVSRGTESAWRYDPLISTEAIGKPFITGSDRKMQIA